MTKDAKVFFTELMKHYPIRLVNLFLLEKRGFTLTFTLPAERTLHITYQGWKVPFCVWGETSGATSIQSGTFEPLQSVDPQEDILELLKVLVPNTLDHTYANSLHELFFGLL